MIRQVPAARFLPLYLLALSSGAQAALDDVCWPTSTSPLVIKFPDRLVIPPTAKAGDELASTEISSTIECNNKWYPTGRRAEIFKDKNNPSRTSDSIYLDTTVSGIGLHWTLETPNESGAFVMSGSSLNSTTPRPTVSFPYLGGQKTYWIRQVFKLVKTRNIGQDRIISFPDFKVSVEPDSFVGGLYRKPLFSYSFSPVQIETAACNLTKSSINVPMDRVQASQFHAPGSTSRQVPFSLSLECDQGASMKLNLDATHQVAGWEGTISLTSSSTAAGVGIQILDAADNTPIPLGKPRDMGVTHSGVNAIGLAARYIQTGNRVSPGTANGALTFSLSYN
ncbi:fimbrial protein [Pseudomonas sp. Q1-7]|uniref:fimbrial protein n=1 Tax=Pseudomonas sp. Q1-7 TaxID=3020843 RepID=UPI0023004352|nr:fimbrial protein [Pseudomonas sp. Q1-7]